MKLICSSFSCNAEKPIEYCKECSHANWIVNKNLSFNPRFGFLSENDIDWNKAGIWYEKFEKTDIEKTSFG